MTMMLTMMLTITVLAKFPVCYHLGPRRCHSFLPFLYFWCIILFLLRWLRLGQYKTRSTALVLLVLGACVRSLFLGSCIDGNSRCRWNLGSSLIVLEYREYVILLALCRIVVTFHSVLESSDTIVIYRVSWIPGCRSSNFLAPLNSLANRINFFD